jgi:hypothetical protein
MAGSAGPIIVPCDKKKFAFRLLPSVEITTDGNGNGPSVSPMPNFVTYLGWPLEHSATLTHVVYTSNLTSLQELL